GVQGLVGPQELGERRLGAIALELGAGGLDGRHIGRRRLPIALPPQRNPFENPLLRPAPSQVYEKFFLLPPLAGGPETLALVLASRARRHLTEAQAQPRIVAAHVEHQGALRDLPMSPPGNVVEDALRLPW